MNERNLTNLLITKFPQWLASYDEHCPFTRYGQREFHVETIHRRLAVGTAGHAIEDELFLRSLYRTLQAWRIGSRASILRPFTDFVEALHDKKAEICELDGVVIDEIQTDTTVVSQKIARIVQTLDIVENKARIVPGSKALHHLLPDLVVPIDRAYTQLFFNWPTPRLQYNPQECFIEAFQVFVNIACSCNPVQYVGSGWYSSRTKVIDNAIVGLLCWARQELKNSKELHTSLE